MGPEVPFIGGIHDLDGDGHAAFQNLDATRDAEIHIQRRADRANLLTGAFIAHHRAERPELIIGMGSEIGDQGIGDTSREIGLATVFGHVLEGQNGNPGRAPVGDQEPPDRGRAQCHGRDQIGRQAHPARFGGGGCYHDWRFHDRRGRRLQRGCLHRRDELKSRLADGFDEAGVPGVVAEGFAQFVNGHGDGLVGHELLAPDLGDDRLFRDDAFRMGGQVGQQLHQARFDLKRQIGLDEPVGGHLDGPVTNDEDRAW